MNIKIGLGDSGASMEDALKALPKKDRRNFRRFYWHTTVLMRGHFLKWADSMDYMGYNQYGGELWASWVTTTFKTHAPLLPLGQWLLPSQ